MYSTFPLPRQSLAIHCKPGVTAKDIGLRETRLQPLKNGPHVDALQSRWKLTQKEWKSQSVVMDTIRT